MVKRVTWNGVPKLATFPMEKRASHLPSFSIERAAHRGRHFKWKRGSGTDQSAAISCCLFLVALNFGDVNPERGFYFLS